MEGRSHRASLALLWGSGVRQMAVLKVALRRETTFKWLFLSYLFLVVKIDTINDIIYQVSYPFELKLVQCY